MKNKILLTITIFLLVCHLINAQENNSFPNTNNTVDTNTDILKKERHKIISGVVLDEKTLRPIPAATLRIQGTNKGTICGKDGTFRFPKGNFINKSDIKITTIGYHTKILTLDLTKDTVTILLKQNPVELNAAVVTGEIEVDEIIRRAIRKKDENRKKHKTIQGLLYSKFSLDMDKFASVFIPKSNTDIKVETNIIRSSDTLSLQDSIDMSNKRDSIITAIQDSLARRDSLAKGFVEGFIGETFTEKYVDIENNIDKAIIVNRRQTANFPKDVNRIVLEEFVDFSLDEINFIDVKIITPLHKNALSYYKFELLEKKIFEDKFVYVINVIPNTSIYPTFQGTISILEGTYQLIEASLKPSVDTKIHLIDNLEYYEKFENVGSDIWFPTYMENKASLKLKTIPFIPPIEMEWTMTSIFSDVIINQPLHDSIYLAHNDTATKVTVIADDVDSAKSKYWEDNALIALSEKEQKRYSVVDAAAKELKLNIDSLWKAATTPIPSPKYSWKLLNLARYNRVEGYAIGLSPIVKIPYTKFTGEGLYLLGQEDLIGSAKFEFGNKIDRPTMNLFGTEIEIGNPAGLLTPYYSVGAEIFSRTNSFGNPFNNEDLSFFSSNGLLVSSRNCFSTDALLLHKDYFDYFRSDGWNAKLKFGYKRFLFVALYENSREFGLNKTTNKSLFSKSEFRDNPQPETGEFQFIKLSSTFGNKTTSLSENFQYNFNINYQYGIRSLDKSNFSQFYGTAAVQFPIFQTGYGNMLLLLSATGGWADENIPVQHLFAIEQSSFFSNLFAPTLNTFITAYESYFGGTEFYTYHAKLNLRDWWWRLLHLPKIKGRGLELSLTATTGRFFNKNNTELFQLYHGTGSKYYTEAGFIIGRIPIPGTDLIYWSLETRFGVGEYAKGRYGILLNFNLPFSFISM